MFRLLTRLLVPVVLVLCALLTGCEQKAEVVSPVLFKVAGRQVSLDQFRTLFDATLHPEQNLTAEQRGELERSFLVQMVDRELTLAEAARLQVVLSAEELSAAIEEHRRDYPEAEFQQMLRERGLPLERWRQELEQSLLMEKVVRQAVYEQVEVSDEDVAAYYKEQKDEFDRPEQVKALQIVVADQAEGQNVLKLIRGGRPFSEVAREYSLSPDAEQGGDLGFFSRGQMPPEFDQAVFTLPVGKVSELVKTEYGYHLFLVQERRKAMQLPLESVREEIRAALKSTREEEAYQQWLGGLRDRATIEIDWTLL